MKKLIMTLALMIAVTSSASADDSKRAKVLEIVGKAQAAATLRSACEMQVTVYGASGINHSSCTKSLNLLGELNTFFKTLTDAGFKDSDFDRMSRSQIDFAMDSIAISNAKINALMQ